MRLTQSRLGGLLATPAALYMAAFFLVPTLFLFVYSFWQASSFRITPAFQFDNYARALVSPLFIRVTLNAITIGLITATITTVLAIAVGYYLTYVTRSRLILYLVLMTWFSSYLVRIYAWRSLLGTNGLLNTILIATGIVDEPIGALLFSPIAVTITLVHIYLPFAILLLVAALSEIKREFIEASRDLGTSELGAFFRVVAPNAAGGIIAAFVLTFILVAGDYVTPQLLGGATGQTTGLLIADQFRKTGNWPLGAAQAFLMFLVSVLVYFVLVGIARLTGFLPARRMRRGAGP